MTSEPPAKSVTPEVGAAGRALLIALAVAVMICGGVAAMLTLTPHLDDREPARTYAVWHASKAVTAYARLRQAIADDHDLSTAEKVGALAQAFVQAVARLHEGDQANAINADASIGALVHRLDTDRKHLPALLLQLDDPGQAQLGRPRVSDDSMELAQLAEAVDRAGSILAEHDREVMDRRHWLVTGLVVVLVLMSLALVAALARRLRIFRATRFALDDTVVRLREALDAVDRADSAKSRFLSSASQDLRAPMDAVVSLADSLLEERLPPMQREITCKIRDAGGSLLRALDEVMDYTTLESGELTLEQRPFSPEAVTTSAATEIEAHARAKGLTIVATPAPGLPKLLVGDAERIGRVLSRLMSNAVKYTEHGGISLQVLCVERDAERATIEWVVTDSGSGIEAARLDVLFGSEGHADDSGPVGNDLGLAVCKRLITRMGGGIRVESVVGQGSRFHVRLPFRVERRAGAGAPVSPSAASLREQLRAMGRRPRLLMAEHTQAGQFILRQLLAREGIAPDVVGDGRAAVKAAQADRYDVICMDLRMPEMNGLEAARRIRSGRGPSANAPIIAVTAGASPADVQACREAGMTMFLAKPVRRETLLNAILLALTDPGAPFIPAATIEQRQAVN